MTTFQIVEKGLHSTHDFLRELVDSDLTVGLNVAFGQGWNAEVSEDLVQDWLTGCYFSSLGQPQIEILPSADIAGANGAFSGATNTIYLSSEYISQNAANPKAIANVLLEETGHYLDWHLNAEDAPGDEGAIFAAIAQGKQLSEPEMLALKAEDDSAIVTLDGQTISIEMSRPSLITFNYRIYQSVQGTDNKIYTRSSSDGENWNAWDEDGGLTPDSPALAVFNGKLYQSHQGTDNKIYTRSSSDGDNWSAWDEDGGLTPSSPALKVFNGKLYQSHQGTDNKIYTRSSSDGENWGAWDEDGGLTPSSPVLAVFNGRLYQSHQGGDNKIYTRSSSDGENWSAWDEDGGLTPSSPALKVFNSKLYQSHQGGDNKIYTRYSSDGENWSAWDEDGGLTPSSPALAVFNGKLYQSVQSGDNKIYTRSSSDGDNWSAWDENGSFPPVSPPNLGIVGDGIHLSRPSIADFAHGISYVGTYHYYYDHEIFQSVKGTDNKIYTRYTSDGEKWSAWDEDGGLTPSSPALAVFNDKLYQSIQGTDNKIYTRHTTAQKGLGGYTPDGNWSAWDEDGGLTPNAPALKVFNGKLYQSIQGGDSKIYTRYTTDGDNWSAWDEEGGFLTPSSPALAVFNGRLYQSHRGTDNKIYTRYTTDGDNWSAWDEDGGLTPSSPALAVFNGKLYQSHRGTDNKIYTRSSSDGDNWSAWDEDGGFTATAPALKTLNMYFSWYFPGYDDRKIRLYQSVVGGDSKIYTRYSTDGENWSPWNEEGGSPPTS